MKIAEQNIKTDNNDYNFKSNVKVNITLIFIHKMLYQPKLM